MFVSTKAVPKVRRSLRPPGYGDRQAVSVAPVELPPRKRAFRIGRDPQLFVVWEKLLTWATYRVLVDFTPLHPFKARAAARRMAHNILDEYGILLGKWLEKS